MMFFGYEKRNDKLLELEEISFQCELKLYCNRLGK